MLLRRVVGNSMLPTLTANQIVIAMHPRRIDVGDVVIVHQGGLEKIKRVAKKRFDGIYVLGDNPEQSTDSRHFGWLTEDMVVAKVVWPKVSSKTRIMSNKTIEKEE